MRALVLGIAAACLLLAAPHAARQAGAGESAFGFDREKIGLPPAGFSLAALRQPGPGQWMVSRKGTNGFLVHAADPRSAGFALAVADLPGPADFVVTARLRLGGGTRAGGLVWRYQDGSNFSALMLDLTHRDLSLYRIAAGNRIRVEHKDDLELDADAWHTLKVTRADGELRVSLGGIRVFEERDRRSTDPDTPSRLGLIAAGDADVWFDDLRINARGRVR